MVRRKKEFRWIMAGIPFLIVCALILTGVSPAFSHGGKSHGGTGFSALQAVQKATEMYDRLISSGKLPEIWETGLISILVSHRQSGDEREYVVQFKRTKSEPDSVYFFFDLKGEYTGSNFTGE